jgi:hypothetical protein
LNTPHKTRRRALFVAALAIIGAGALTLSTQASAVDIVTGATATKSCPQGPYAPGDIIPCLATFVNTGNAPATVDFLTEQAPWITPGNAGNGPIVPLACTIPGGQVIAQGSVMPPGAVCADTFLVTVPNNPALCNTFFRDRVEISLSYPQPPPNPPLASGANATNTVFIQCLPSITVDKTASPQSKVTDPVDYSITICNTSLITVNRVSVNDTLVGDIAANFPASLAPGACATYNYQRTVVAGDPDQLANTVTAVYSGAGASATAADTALTDLFQPGVDVQKSCVPPVNEVGGISTCTIVVTNTSSGDAPALTNGTISDTLTGDLLDGGNAAIQSSDCTADLATGASCTIVTTRVIAADDPNPLVNEVTVHYNPIGFPNDITDSAQASVIIVTPSITVTKTADELSKPTDPVAYTITVCNTGTFPVSPTSVIDSLVGDITGNFVALNSGDCQTYSYQRTALSTDPDPLINSVTATYGNAGGATATATATASTNLFYPGVDVTKQCQPDPVTVGQSLVCTIHVTNTSSADSPALTNGTIMDTLYGNLLAANTAVTSNTCTGTLATGASCEITTSKVVATALPNPLVNTVTVHYNPIGFPNDITDSATASVTVRPPAGTGCTPGFWKQTQHFYAWVGYSPNQTFASVFGRVITIKVDNKTVTNPTLLQALGAQGGDINALARFAVNALLNATSTTGADFTVAQVIAIVQSGIDPGGLTIEQAHTTLSNAPGVVNDNCRLVITVKPK